MELMKENVQASESVASGTAQIMVDGDIIVPDVKPDILKILQVDAVAVVTDRTVTNGRVNVDGKVNLKILYIPDREDEKIKSILTSFDFSHCIDKQQVGENMGVDLEADVERVEFQLLNSRKLRAKAIVGLGYEVNNIHNIQVVTGVDEPDCLEIVKKPMRMHNVIDNVERGFVLKESMEVPSGQSSIREILKMDVKTSDKDYKVVTGKVVAKGVVNVCVLYIAANGGIEFMELDIPFTEVFDMEDATDGVECEMDYVVSDVEYEAVEDNDGDCRIVNMDLVLTAKIKAWSEMEVEVISDCYGPGWETKLDRKEITIDEVVARPKAQNTLREMISVGRNLPQMIGIYNVITRAFISGTSVERDRIAVEGKIEAYLLYLSDSEESPVYSYKQEIPYSYVLDSPGAKPGMECDIKAEVEHASYNLNMANEAELRCILSINANVVQKKKVWLIDEIDLLPIGEDNKKGIVIYFVQAGDSLWDIAKRYSVAVDDILKCNNLSEEDIVQGTQLIVPSCMKKKAE